MFKSFIMPTVLVICSALVVGFTKSRDDVSLFGFHLGQKLDVKSRETLDFVDEIVELKFHPDGCRRYRFKPVVPFEVLNHYVITVDAKTDKIIEIMGEYDMELNLDGKGELGTHFVEVNSIDYNKENPQNNNGTRPVSYSTTTWGRKCVKCISRAITELQIKFSRQVERHGRFKQYYEQCASNSNIPVEYKGYDVDFRGMALFYDKPEPYNLFIDASNRRPDLRRETNDAIVFKFTFNNKQEIRCYSSRRPYMWVRLVARDNAFLEQLRSPGNMATFGGL